MHTWPPPGLSAYKPNDMRKCALAHTRIPFLETTATPIRTRLGPHASPPLQCVTVGKVEVNSHTGAQLERRKGPDCVYHHQTLTCWMQAPEDTGTAMEFPDTTLPWPPLLTTSPAHRKPGLPPHRPCNHLPLGLQQDVGEALCQPLRPSKHSDQLPSTL